jgi:hypothetical protein
MILAREARSAVIFRRGPSRHTAVIGWDRTTDKFQLGQWLYGRIYERRCDLSPDGKYLIYFAMNGRWQSEVKGSWTAISRTPFLKALTLFAKGDCWNGGGLFFSSREYWLNEAYGYEHELQTNDSTFMRRAEAPWHERYGGECPGVYFIRLQRDGWSMKSRGVAGNGAHMTVFDKRINDRWILRKFAHATVDPAPGRGVYHDTHALVGTHAEEVIECTDWDSAEVDRDRLVWTSAGALYSGQIRSKGLASIKLLHDFSSMKYERLQAPY